MLLPKFKGLTEERKKIYKKLREQARSHTSLDGIGRLINQIRPSETQAIRDFRVENARLITMAEYQAWVRSVAMVFTNNGMSLSLSDILKEYLDSSPFFIDYTDYDLTTWFFNIAFPDSLEDPNGYFVVYPRKEDYTDTKTKNRPDIKYFNSSEYMGTINWTLSTGKVEDEKYIVANEIFQYFAVELVADNMVTGLHEHWLVSETKVVVLRDEVGKKDPVQVFWHLHNQMSLPIVSPPALKSSEGKYKVRVSFLSGMLPLWDEAASNFSDAQAIANKANFPTLVMPAMPCKKCTGLGRIYDNNDSDKFTICVDCNGSKYDAGLTPYTTISIPGGNVMNDSNVSKNIYWMSPDVAIVNNSFDRAMLLLEKAEKKGGMVTIETANNEAGTSRAMRFQSKQEMLGQIAALTKIFLESILYYMEGYLVMNESDRVMPIVTFPTYLNVKDEEALRMEAVEAPLAERPAAYLKWISEKHKGNDNYIRAWDIALELCPLIVMNQAEIDSAVMSSIYNDLYIYMKDVIVTTCYKLIQEDHNKDNNSIAALAVTKVKAMFELVRPQPQTIDANQTGQA